MLCCDYILDDKLFWLLAIVASRVLTVADANLAMTSETGGKQKLQRPELGG